jgi:hypothetical protein
MRESLVWVFGLIALCFILIARAEVEPGASAEVIQARWDVRNLPFSYVGTTTRYSCSALEEKIRNILIAVGGHPSTRVRAVGCQGARPSRVISLGIATAVPRPASEPKTSQVIEREKLLARFGVRSGPQGEFLARQRRVSLSKSSLSLAPGDCELLAQLRDQVFPKLDVVVVVGKSKLSCSPHQLSSARPQLSVVALVPSKDAMMVMPDPGEVAED